MKMKSILLAATIVVSTPVMATEYTSYYPPAQFDVPYTGELTIWTVQSQQLVREFCPGDFRFFATTCAKRNNFERCDIYMLKFEAWPKELHRKSTAFALRHELAHCNGWDQDHTGGKKVPASTRVDMPKFPPSTRWLPAYPPLVCMTPDRAIEPCEARKSFLAGAT
jgi:hypothetical protein